MIPLWSAPSSSSRSERIIPSETSPRSFALLERVAAREDGAGQRDRDRRPGAEVPGAADDLARLALAHVHAAELEPVGVRVLARLDARGRRGRARGCRRRRATPRRVDRARPRRSRSARRVGELASGASEPRRSRAARRAGPSSELPQERGGRSARAAPISGCRGGAGDALEPEAEGEARPLLRVVADELEARRDRPCRSRPARSSPRACTRGSPRRRRGSRRRPARSKAP